MAREGSGLDPVAEVRARYERSFGPSEVIFDPGEPGELLYVIRSGAVEIQKAVPFGPATVARLGPGEVFGELSVLVGAPRLERAVAVAPTRLLALDGPTCEAMCLERPEIALRLLRHLAHRVAELERSAGERAIEPMVRPVVAALLAQMPAGQESARIEPRLRGIAEAAGLDLFATYRAIQELIERKQVRLVNDALFVPSRSELLRASPDRTGA